MAEHDATKQVTEGRALRLKSARSIVGGEVIQVGGPMMVLGNNDQLVELHSDDESAAAAHGGEVIQVGGPMMVLGNNDQLVELHSDDESAAAAQVLATPAAKKIRRRNSDDGRAAGSTATNNKTFCRDLIDSLTKTRQGKAEVEAMRFDFEKQMAEQNFEKEKQDSQRQHEIQLRSMDLQKTQLKYGGQRRQTPRVVLATTLTTQE